MAIIPKWLIQYLYGMVNIVIPNSESQQLNIKTDCFFPNSLCWYTEAQMFTFKYVCIRIVCWCLCCRPVVLADYGIITTLWCEGQDKGAALISYSNIQTAKTWQDRHLQKT